MDLIQIVILSVVEGVTEFLPISSTGHLILVSSLLKIPESTFLTTFQIAIQLGAILAVVFLYFGKLTKDFKIYRKLLIAFIPTALVGFLLYPFIKSFLLSSSSVTLWSLFAGGIVLILLEKIIKIKKTKVVSLDSISDKQAFFVGVIQSLSVVPGVSRAAATIIGGIFAGFDRRVATEFSFLLAIPTMFAATAYDIYKSASVFNPQNLQSLSIGFILSFIFAFLSIKFLLNFVKKNNFEVFGIYRILLAILFWMLLT